MENDNNIDHNDHNNYNLVEKVVCECDCGCGLTFLHGENLGFKINVIGEDAILKEDQMVMDLFVYIPLHIGTWGELMDLIANSRRNLPNDKVWYHLSAYLEKRHEIVDDTSIEFVYLN